MMAGLLIALRKCDRRRSQRVFNACLLPLIDDHQGEFRPQRYGREGTCFQSITSFPRPLSKRTLPEALRPRASSTTPPFLAQPTTRKTISDARRSRPGGTYAREVELADVDSHAYIAGRLIPRSKRYATRLAAFSGNERPKSDWRSTTRLDLRRLRQRLQALVPPVRQFAHC